MYQKKNTHIGPKLITNINVSNCRNYKYISRVNNSSQNTKVRKINTNKQSNVNN